MKRIATLLLAASMLTGCTIGGPGVSRYFDCSGGARLKVTMTAGGAIVEEGKGLPIVLKGTPSTGASVFENDRGYRLSMSGDTARWNGPTREAAKMCRSVAVPR